MNLIGDGCGLRHHRIAGIHLAIAYRLIGGARPALGAFLARGFRHGGGLVWNLGLFGLHAMTTRQRAFVARCNAN